MIGIAEKCYQGVNVHSVHMVIVTAGQRVAVTTVIGGGGAMGLLDLLEEIGLATLPGLSYLLVGLVMLG